MIIVPESNPSTMNILPGDTPAAPSRNSHQLAASDSGANAAAGQYGAMFMGFSHELAHEEQVRALGDSPEYQLAVLIKRVLDHAVVKDAVTAMHQEHDAHRETLTAADTDALQTMLVDEEVFLRDQERRFAASCTDDRQRSLFRTMTAEYFTEAMERVKMLRNRKVLEFQREVMGRQNQEFVNRALLPDTVFNDALQTAYRDLILYNLDNLHADAPAAERAARLDEACREYYTRIIEKRLETDPARLAPMLQSSAVRRVLGKQIVREYTDKANAATKHDALSRQAQKWVDESAAPSKAKILAARLPEADRAPALECYRYWRLQDNRRHFLECVVTMEKGWAAVREGEYRHAAIPATIQRNHPEIDALFRRCLDRRRKNGGIPPEPDYSRLTDLVCDHQPAKWAETLREPGQASAFTNDLGGPDGPAFQAGLRFLIGKATEEDACFFADLRIARTVWKRAERDGKTERDFFAQFSKKRRIHMEREKLAELHSEEAVAIAEECLA